MALQNRKKGVTRILKEMAISLQLGILVVTLGLIEGSYALVFLVGDILLYIIYKMMRGGLRYLVSINGVAGMAISLLMRVVVKIITDFKGCIYFRHPYEVRGAADLTCKSSF